MFSACVLFLFSFLFSFCVLFVFFLIYFCFPFVFAWLPAPHLPRMKNFDQEEAETQYKDDERQNDAWQAVFDDGDKVQKSALHPCLGAMSVHKEHRIFHHRASTSASNMGIQHVGQPKATSRLSWESVEAGRGGPQENGEPRPPTDRARVAPLCRRCAANRDGCGESLSVTWATLRHARSRSALWVGRLGRVSEGRMIPFFLCWSDVAPVCGLLVLRAFFCSSCSNCRAFFCVWFLCTAPGPVILGPRCLIQNSSKIFFF